MEVLKLDLSDSFPMFVIKGIVLEKRFMESTRLNDKTKSYWKIKIICAETKNRFTLFTYKDVLLSFNKEYTFMGYINSINGINIFLNVRKIFDYSYLYAIEEESDNLKDCFKHIDHIFDASAMQITEQTSMLDDTLERKPLCHKG